MSELVSEEEPYLPLLFLCIVELQRSGYAPDKLLELFRNVTYFRRRQEVEARQKVKVEEKAEAGQETTEWQTELWTGNYKYSFFPLYKKNNSNWCPEYDLVAFFGLHLSIPSLSSVLAFFDFSATLSTLFVLS